MTRALRCGWLMSGLMLGLACGTEQPTGPSAVRVLPTIAQPPTPPPEGLPLANPSRPTFSAAHSITPFAVLRPARNSLV